MKGFKTASGVIALIEGLGVLLSGIAFAVFGGIGGSMMDDILNSLLGEAGLPELGLGFGIGTLLIIVGAILAVFGLIYFILGIKACKSSSGKGTGVALLIFSIFLLNPLVFIFCIIYLATRGSQNQDYGGGGQSYGGGNNNDYSSDSRYV